MPNRLANFLEALHQRPKTVLTGIVAVLLCSAIGLRNIRFDTSLTSFFPPDSSAAKTLAFLNDAALAGKVAISFGRDAETPEDVLHDAVAAFAANVATLPNIKNVLHTVDGSTWQTGLANFYELMPQWFDATALEEFSPRLEPEAAAAALKRRFSQLARPEGMFLVDATRRDPLGFFDAQLAKLGNAAGNMGYDVIPDAGRLMSRDGLHRLVLLDTDASASDMRASETLLHGIENALAELPSGIFADVVCAHSHAVANQAAVKRDLTLAGALSAVLLLLMLLFVYRDARLLMVALVPLFSVLVAFPMCAAVFGGVTFLACAFGSVLAGLSVDYAIHIYRAGGKIRELLRPLLAGMGTTFAVFCGFFVSGAEGWKQVGCFEIGRAHV
jgi:predicted exporter